MKIGVLSDTHIPNRARSLPSELFQVFKGVELIIHAGDLVQEEVLTDLLSIAPVEAVAGNMDPPHLEKKLGQKKLLELGGLRIGVTHGSGSKHSTMERAYLTFTGEAPHCIVFGHSHQPCNTLYQGVLLFNPGSPTDKRREKYPSCGLLNITEGRISGEIIRLPAKRGRFPFSL